MADASGAKTIAAGTSAIPAIWAMPISGIARKLSPSPAHVTREKTVAPIGKSIASAATDIMNIITTGTVGRGRRQAVATGTVTRIASVAPQVSRNAGSVTTSGSVATRTAATTVSA